MPWPMAQNHTPADNGVIGSGECDGSCVQVPSGSGMERRDRSALDEPELLAGEAELDVHRDAEPVLRRTDEVDDAAHLVVARDLVLRLWQQYAAPRVSCRHEPCV